MATLKKPRPFGKLGRLRLASLLQSQKFRFARHLADDKQLFQVERIEQHGLNSAHVEVPLDRKSLRALSARISWCGQGRTPRCDLENGQLRHREDIPAHKLGGAALIQQVLVGRNYKTANACRLGSSR